MASLTLSAKCGFARQSVLLCHPCEGSLQPLHDHTLDPRAISASPDASMRGDRGSRWLSSCRAHPSIAHVRAVSALAGTINRAAELELEPSIVGVASAVDAAAADDPTDAAMDQFTFCAALGPDEGNRQLRRHWSAWVREEDIRAIAETGANTVRIPVGDWMYVPYGAPADCWREQLSLPPTLHP